MNTKQTHFRLHIASVLFLIIMTGLMGCSDSPPEESGGQARNEKFTVPEKPTQKTVYKEEIYGDPDIFSEPRLQFVWQAPTEEKYTIWSTRLDGSDLRRVLPPDLLFAKDGVIFHLPIRSPDNRYLAVSLDSNEVMGTIKMLFDLKEKTATELGRGAYVPDFQWTSDSRFLYYYNDDGFWKYDVKSKTNHDTPVIYSSGLFILNDDRFVSLHHDYYEVYSKERKKLFEKSINYGVIAHSFQTVANDGSMIFCVVGGKEQPFSIIFNLNNPEKVYYKAADTIYSSPAFDLSNKRLYFSNGSVEYLDIKTKKETQVFTLPGGTIAHLSMLNPLN
ncbi:hypothetical protein [Desulfoluna butyratoxydans]|uniref:hypothetical protein n=1 Tax=Desulfoluna butyratoxydans TaxID=231438 RepID=UPI0015D39C03|nr:hypothetical protein [Desulfoluna butyratoxydans]